MSVRQDPPSGETVNFAGPDDLVEWAADAVLRQFGTSPAVSAVYLAGSLLAGLGSPTSDVDVFVVRDGADETEVPEQLLIGGRRFDVETLLPGTLRTLVEDVTCFERVTYGDMSPVHQSESRYDLAVRLLLSRPVLTGKEYEDAVALLRSREREFRRMLITKWAAECLAIHEDVRGAFEDDQRDDALFSAADLMRYAAQAYLAGCADLYVKHKWIPRKLRRSGGPRFPYGEFRRLLGGWPEGREEQGGLLAERVRFCQAMVVAALVDGWEDARAAEWRSWSASTGPGSGLLRSVEWMPLRLTDRIVLAQSMDKAFRISPQGLRLWGLCDGRDKADVIGEMMDHLKDEGLRGEVESYLRRFEDNGLVVHG
ncbi:nucleotidyltransferase domain-containing protein [Sphaerisporangium corydalis]|uniref:Nucleotidyltransferase domain-containing protein n=1 Tax=Sphaerisporangium corydalis TaxID=1441875 RepID=A0ABV9EH59_9ACTN|nr:nucleotidyltransferase domain-containing protein [Sphaerisporangium corydalis]